jgi:hypothetical protein
MKFNFKIESPNYNKTVELEGYQILDGNFLFDTHPEIDIVVDKVKGKIITFPKEKIGYEAYHSQDRCLNYFAKKGLIDRGSIKSGNVSNSLEATLLNPDEESINKINVCLFSLYNFLKLEEPYFSFAEDFEEDFNDDLFEPDPEDSTELGEVPHQEKKGAVPPGKYYGYGYGYRPYVYEHVEKGKNK